MWEKLLAPNPFFKSKAQQMSRLYLVYSEKKYIYFFLFFSSPTYYAVV